ncbi:MAG: hypothetical protein ACPG49_13400 [Chitinophagales bacterium]
MKKPAKLQTWLWIGIFAFLLFLSFDYWAWSNPVVLSWGAFPSWLYYFMGLQAIFVLAIFSFTKLYWKE